MAPPIAAPSGRLLRAIALLAVVLVAGSVGYWLLGFSLLNAVYQAVTTIATIGFREVEHFGTAEKLFTIALVPLGVGAALYTFSAVLEQIVEGHFSTSVRRRRMQRRIDAMSGHVIVCGWGRVGHAVAEMLIGNGYDVVVVDIDPERVEALDLPHVVGDANEDSVLLLAGVDRAKALIAALTTDADNLFVTLSSRAIRPDLFIVSRARHVDTQSKLLQAGANRVVNPQAIGGARMAAFAAQPHVVEFLDVVMHDGSLEFRLEEIRVSAGSPLAGTTLRESHLRDRTGALVLAVRGADGVFVTNPDPATELQPGQVLIAIGTNAQLEALADVAR